MHKWNALSLSISLFLISKKEKKHWILYQFYLNFFCCCCCLFRLPVCSLSKIQNRKIESVMTMMMNLLFLLIELIILVAIVIAIVIAVTMSAGIVPVSSVLIVLIATIVTTLVLVTIVTALLLLVEVLKCDLVRIELVKRNEINWTWLRFKPWESKKLDKKKRK